MKSKLEVDFELMAFRRLVGYSTTGPRHHFDVRIEINILRDNCIRSQGSAGRVMRGENVHLLRNSHEDTSYAYLCFPRLTKLCKGDIVTGLLMRLCVCT